MARCESIWHASGGRYRTIRQLAIGGTAVVHLVEEVERGVVWVAKAHHLVSAPDWKGWELFERSARVLAALDHPGIPRFRELIRREEAGSVDLWVIEEYIPGKNLHDMVVQHGPPPVGRAIGVACAVLSVLDYLHRLEPPVIHRDIKPANIILKPDHTLALVDFGAVKNAARDCTLGGSTVVGSYGYMPPEQYMGRAEPASDLYGVGATLLYLLTGVSPADFPVRDMRVDFSRAVRQPELAPVLGRLLEPRVEHRFSSASDAMVALAAAGRALARADAAHRQAATAASSAPTDPTAEHMVQPGGGVTCPACGTATDVLMVGPEGSEVDGCPDCGGRWLDHGELDEMMERPLLERPDLNAIRRQVRQMPRLPDAVVYRRCPRCDSVMMRVNFAGTSGIMVDECARHGLWLDRGELEAIRQFVALGGMDLAEQRDHDRTIESAKRERARSREDAQRMRKAARQRFRF